MNRPWCVSFGYSVSILIPSIQAVAGSYDVVCCHKSSSAEAASRVALNMKYWNPKSEIHNLTMANPDKPGVLCALKNSVILFNLFGENDVWTQPNTLPILKVFLPPSLDLLLLLLLDDLLLFYCYSCDLTSSPLHICSSMVLVVYFHMLQYSTEKR